MTPAEETVAVFRDAGALIDDDHFVYVSGDHGAGWVAKDLLYPDTSAPERLATLLADRVREIGWRPAYVCGPATGGLVMSQWVAHALGARSVFTEHDPTVPGPSAPFVLRRGFDTMVAGAPVLAVDDIVNTGHSLGQTVRALGACGAEVVGAATWVTRGNTDAVRLGVPAFTWLAEVDIPSWPAADCDLCRRGVPVNTRYAHGAEYVTRHTA
ncbi:MAG: orotate phosphoribosyltransferase [Acidimicrobiales bacterium]